MFGLLFTYITGALIIIISFALDHILKFLHNRYKYKNYAYLEWTTNGTLQLHRLAQEERDMGTWSGAVDTVPITNGDDMLASLDIVDLKHPILVSQPVSTLVEEFKSEQSLKLSRDSTHSATGDPVESAAGNVSNQDNSIDETLASDRVSYGDEINDGAQAFGVETHEIPQSSFQRHRLSEGYDSNECLGPNEGQPT